MNTRRITKDDILSSIQKNWLTEIEVKKTVSAKRIFRFSVLRIHGFKDDHFILKYFASGILPRLVKIKYIDILNFKSSFKRKKYLTNIEIMKITQLKKSQERKTLRRKTLFNKILISLLIISISVGVITGITFLV